MDKVSHPYLLPALFFFFFNSSLPVSFAAVLRCAGLMYPTGRDTIIRSALNVKFQKIKVQWGFFDASFEVLENIYCQK